MKKSNRIIYLITVFFIFSIQNLFALETETHEEINEFIGTNLVNGFLLNNYLSDELGFQDGVGETFVWYKTQMVYRWLGKGGRREDLPSWYLPYFRSVNHFHNPLALDIENAGFSGFLGGWLLHGKSSILWAQMPYGQQSPGGYYSWEDVRNYFHAALIATDITERDMYFAATFRGLGQLMHLVQDLSVPEHTRDAVHILPAYEKWVLKNVQFDSDNGEISVYDNQVGKPVPLTPPVHYSYDKSVLMQESPFSEAPLPIAWLFDSNQYTGANPDITLRADIGLSEYTNANFVSKGTVFAERFPYPAETSVVVEEHEISHPQLTDPVLREYYMKVQDGDVGYRLSGVGYLYYYEETYYIDGANFYHSIEFPPMDRYVFEDYAKKLIPRAVGYSAGLLEYFFRGRMQVKAMPAFYEGSLFAFRMTVKNDTPTEETMGDGFFSLLLRYTPIGANPDGSEDVFVRSYDVPYDEIRYGEEAKFQIQLQDLIPIAETESIDCMLVYGGQLGHEKNAVIAKAFSFFPGEKIKFAEDWDNGLTGHYPWYHSDESQNPDNGITINEVANGYFEKGNIRHTGDRRKRINESYIYFKNVNSNHQIVDPGNPHGLQITPDTYVQFKIDEMSINQQPPAFGPGYTTAFQYMTLTFNIGSDLHRIQFTQPGQEVGHYSGTNVYYIFQLGGFMAENIYELFERQGVSVPDSLYLQKIHLNQQLLSLDNRSEIEHVQQMTTDVINIVEGYNGYE